MLVRHSLTILVLVLAFAPPFVRTAAPPATPVAPTEPKTYTNQAVMLQGRDNQVWSVALSPDGNALAVGHGGPRQQQNATGGITLWDMKIGTERFSLPLEKTVRWVTFSPDDKSLATGARGGSLQLFSPKTGKRAAVIGLRTGGIRGNGSIMMWDTRTWTEKTSILGHSALSFMVEFSSDGRTL